MMEQWMIGNQEPFKVTPKTAKNLIEAIVKTESSVVHMREDDTCPPLHIIARIETSSKNKKKFEQIIGRLLEDPPHAISG
jgi:hypothetical protein